MLIIGGGVYGLVAKEIAESMNCFEKIAFVDDNAITTPNGIEVIGKTDDVKKLSLIYGNAIIAIGAPQVRLTLLRKIEEQTNCKIVTLVSPRAYVSPTARIEKGCIIEPMSVIHTGATLLTGCIVSAGAVVNHASVCHEGVHVDCNATVLGGAQVPSATKIHGGEVFR